MIPFHSLTFSVSRKDCFQLSRLSDGMLLFLALSLTHFIVTGEGSVARFVSFYTLFRRRQWHPTPVLLPGKSHGQRSLVGCSPWGREELDKTERLHFHFSLSCIGEGDGNPLQCSCLENPRDGEPGGLLSMGSHRVGHNSSNLAAAATAYIIC